MVEVRAAASGLRHRQDCTFGPGFWKVTLTLASGEDHTEWFTLKEDADEFLRGLTPLARPRAYRDACLDGVTAGRFSVPLLTPEYIGDASTPDVVDGEWWLSLPRKQAMDELGLVTDEEYAKVASSVEDMVNARNNRESQGGIRAPIILKRRKTPETAGLFHGGKLSRLKAIRQG